MLTEQCIGLVYLTLECTNLLLTHSSLKLQQVCLQHLFKMLKDDTIDSQNLHTSASVQVSI